MLLLKSPRFRSRVPDMLIQLKKKMSTSLFGEVLVKFSQQMDHSPEISPCFEQVSFLASLLPSEIRDPDLQIGDP